MPAGGLETCKKTCDGNMQCYAFEYSVKGDCCVFRGMCDPKEPTVTNATHHGDMYKDYKGYVKGMMVMIFRTVKISFILHYSVYHEF